MISLRALGFVLPLGLGAAEATVDSLLAEARVLYYASVTDKEKIDPAIDLFRKIGQLDETYQERALTYIGSLPREVTRRNGAPAWQSTRRRLVEKNSFLLLPKPQFRFDKIRRCLRIRCRDHFADQTDGKHLHADDHQQNAEKQQRAIGEID